MKSNGTTYGYIRVSTLAQREDRQRKAMEEFGIPRKFIFADKQSGKDFDRPAYAKLMETVKPGDTVVVKSLDRLGRNYDEMLQQMHILIEEKEVYFVVLDLPLIDSRQKSSNDLTGKFISQLVIQIFSFVAETERTMNHQRTQEGLEVARARGVKLGRRPMEKPKNFEKVLTQWKAGELSGREAARRLDVSHFTFQKWAKE